VLSANTCLWNKAIKSKDAASISGLRTEIRRLIGRAILDLVDFLIFILRLQKIFDAGAVLNFCLLAKDNFDHILYNRPVNQKYLKKAKWLRNKAAAMDCLLIAAAFNAV
jgi:hypothetical protein